MLCFMPSASAVRMWAVIDALGVHNSTCQVLPRWMACSSERLR
jgi:hypothetical protein